MQEAAWQRVNTQFAKAITNTLAFCNDGRPGSSHLQHAKLAFESARKMQINFLPGIADTKHHHF